MVCRSLQFILFGHSKRPEYPGWLRHEDFATFAPNTNEVGITKETKCGGELSLSSELGGFDAKANVRSYRKSLCIVTGNLCRNKAKSKRGLSLESLGRQCN